MGWDILIVWFTLTNAVLGSKSDVTTVWCVNDDITSQPNLVKGIKREEMLCKAETISNYPFTVERARTSPKPESIDLSYITYKTSEEKNSRQIAVLVTWTYKVGYFPQIESYHIELNYVKPSGSPMQYLMTWDRNLTLVLENTSAKLVKFNFLYCGRPGSYHIHPKDVYIFRIQACPIYQEIQDPQIVHKNITIPDCDNKTISKVQHCSCPEGQKKKRGRCRNVIKPLPPLPGTNDDFIATTGTINPCPLTGPSQLSSEKQGLDSTHTIILTIGVVLIFIFSAFAIWMYRQHRHICCTRTSKQTVQKKRRVLLICTSDSEFLEPMNQLIDIFSEFPHLDLNCNLRQRNEIGDWGVHEWTKKVLHNADVIAFLVANSYGAITNKEENESSQLEDNIDHQVGLVLKATEKIIVSNKKESSDKKFVLVDIKNSTTKENLQYFQHFKLPADFNKFTKIVLGEKTHVSAKDRSIFLHSLAIAQLGGYCKQKAPEAQNDLDRSSQLSLPYDDHIDGGLYPRNIGFDGPPSAESNKSVCYTADFNNDQKERLHQAGARPKVSC